jgi:hypothetical protein
MTVKDSHGRAAIAGLQAQLPEDSQVRTGMVYCLRSHVRTVRKRSRGRTASVSVTERLSPDSCYMAPYTGTLLQDTEDKKAMKYIRGRTPVIRQPWQDGFDRTARKKQLGQIAKTGQP